MKKPKYSIVIPSYNGYQGLKETLPYMLAINRDDFEIVISDNHSADGLWEYLSNLSDEKLKIFKPDRFLPHSEHLNFAYSKANGEWIGHLGDDDLIMGNRFEIFDKFSSDFDLIIGKNLRYIWQDNLREPKNSLSRLSKTSFTYEKVVLSRQRLLS